MTFLVRADAHVMCDAESLESAMRYLRYFKEMWEKVGGDKNVQWNIVEVKDCGSS